METLHNIITSPPSGYFIPSTGNLGPIGRNMSPISPSSNATTPSPTGAASAQDTEASHVLAAALRIQTTSSNGNTSNTADANGNADGVANQNANGTASSNGNVNTNTNAAAHSKYVSLYVGDLSPTVKDENLFEFFQKENLKIVTVKVCRDMQTGESLGYGYANFLTHDDASLAIQKLNHTVFCTKPIRLMWSIRDSEARKNGIGNLFVKNLNLSCDNARLYEIFANIGTVLSVKVVRNADRSSRGYGYVQFESRELADAAIHALNGTVVDGNKLSVAHYIKKSERMGTSPDGFTNLYMKNLDEDIDEELIRLKFSQYGPIVSVMIKRDDSGVSKGFGFVCFENADSAKRAVESMNGVQLGNKTLYVSKAQKKAEREQFLISQKEERLKERHMKTLGANVYVKNLQEDVDDMTLNKYFSQCGSITSAKVMRNEQGISKGFGFVCYSSPEEAEKAVTTLHRQFFHDKPLYVAMAERKDDRKVRLQQQFSTAIPANSFASPSNGYASPAYPSLYFAPSRASLVPQYGQGLMAQSFPIGTVGAIGAAVWGSTYIPAYQQVTSPVVPTTSRQRLYNRGRSTAYPQRNYRYQPRYQQNSRNMVMKYMPTSGRFDANLSETMPSGGASTSRTNSMEAGESFFTNPNAAGTIDQQRLLLRDRLFPLIEKLKPNLASKIIGLVMEMEIAELVELIENPELVPAKVENVVRKIELENPTYQ
ncbi:Polyadenylate-binding protein [Rhynchospora pubera]|uniref:Polyadenylate-binding protein n=1 Tax=Rhynchospora pubera TaxID=906938 RepID=A0AAV8CZT6_9POAL|nr:Polyadenylate-binding protein [Rhynchospora pubera]